jgi:hypothetical protein
MTVTPIDENNDGIIDQYNMTMRIKKPSSDLALN